MSFTEGVKQTFSVHTEGMTKHNLLNIGNKMRSKSSEDIIQFKENIVVFKNARSTQVYKGMQAI